MNKCIVFCALLFSFFLAPVVAEESTPVDETQSEASSSETSTDAVTEAIQAMGGGSRKQLIKAVKKLGELGDPKALDVLTALQDKRLQVDEQGKVYIQSEQGEQFTDAITGEVVNVDAASLSEPRINNAVRRALTPAIAKLRLIAPDPFVRLKAAMELVKRPGDAAGDEIRAALKKEENAAVKKMLQLALAQSDIKHEDPERRLEAVQILGATSELRYLSDLKALLNKDEDGKYIESDSRVRAAAKVAVGSIEDQQAIINTTANLLYGLSLGSVLLLAALGLAITFGLMGVINMAHGEMLMLGAYATYVTQLLFQQYFPEALDWYLIAAIPIAFATSAVIGMAMERTIIRHLYGRPLETLLATWGISLLLIQTVRLQFGAQNVEVANPSWLSGGVELMTGLVLPYNRIAIIIFSVFVVGLVWALLQRTALGLQVRAVTQNRSMASCMGISTSRVDMWTFGLGSGVAGLGGVALSQIGNVGPELGQSYIVDSFMVVVLGGVGKIAGTVAGALGLGIINKFLEPAVGAVLGKIFVLVFIILFIQKRPQGIFALKGRAVEN